MMNQISSLSAKSFSVSTIASTVRRIRWVFPAILGWMLALTFAASAQDLSNDTVHLRLNVTPEGVPVIEEATWIATGRTIFRDLGTPDGLGAFVPAQLLPAVNPAQSWTISEGDDIITAEATSQLAQKIFVTWVVELPKKGHLIRLHVRILNRGKKQQSFETFPSWLASWDVAGQSQWARWWRALDYDRTEQQLSDGSRILLASKQHSSDDLDGGVAPYWIVGGTDSRLYFGLQWSGGWSAKLQGLDNGFRFAVSLPPDQSQLVLSRGESIDGPALLVTPTVGVDDTFGRSIWMRQRTALASILYANPPTSVPFIYNHWYAIRQQVDDNFLNSQIAAMAPYTFDAFVVDAGWFVEGRWKPDPAKFKNGELTSMFTLMKANGVKPGLWSTPQYVSDANNQSSLTIEQPPVTSRFFGGFLVDLSDSDFSTGLTDHVQLLRKKYAIDYWKYDQPFFSDQSRAGEMKNVVGFQNALGAVRAANPDLFIENCLNGGRMINDFTMLATQASWLKDLGSSGMPDPRGNISVALNALDFVFPWAALRFTVNIDQINPNDDELLRLCCRSGMAGIWGLSTDLSKISEHQQGIIINEIANYRRLSHLKLDSLYDLRLPSDTASTVGVTYYSRRRFKAGILLYRWNTIGTISQNIALPKLKSWVTYKVLDADTGVESIVSGSDLINNGLNISLENRRNSALIFIDAVNEPAPTP